MDAVRHWEPLLCYLQTAYGDKVDNLLVQTGTG